MRFNDKEMAVVARRKGQIEGRLSYRTPPGTFRDTAFRERYFKLVNNLLFYFRFNEIGQIDDKEPVGLLVLENYTVRVEKDSDYSFAFGIYFLDEPDKRHIFTARSDEDVNRWVNIIRLASYQHWKSRLGALQSNIKALKDARDSITQDKLNQRNLLQGAQGMNDLCLTDGVQLQPSPSQRRNPFLNLTTTESVRPPLPNKPGQSPKVPPRPRGTNPPIATKSNNNNHNEKKSEDLIKF